MRHPTPGLRRPRSSSYRPALSGVVSASSRGGGAREAHRDLRGNRQTDPDIAATRIAHRDVAPHPHRPLRNAAASHHSPYARHASRQSKERESRRSPPHPIFRLDMPFQLAYLIWYTVVADDPLASARNSGRLLSHRRRRGAGSRLVENFARSRSASYRSRPRRRAVRLASRASDLSAVERRFMGAAQLAAQRQNLPVYCSFSMRAGLAWCTASSRRPRKRRRAIWSWRAGA